MKKVARTHHVERAVQEVIKSFGLRPSSQPRAPRLPVTYEDVTWDYDDLADVLYVHFGPVREATQVIERDDEGLILRYRDDWLIGVTILDPLNPRKFSFIPFQLQAAH